MSKGTINVSVENIFPLIKKFLYSDHEIFLRELVSNATDATLKLKHLTNIGEVSVKYGTPKIEIKIDKEGEHQFRKFYTYQKQEELFCPLLSFRLKSPAKDGSIERVLSTSNKLGLLFLK